MLLFGLKPQDKVGLDMENRGQTPLVCIKLVLGVMFTYSQFYSGDIVNCMSSEVT